MSLRKLSHADVPRDWETQLAEIWPREDNLIWPKLIWEPGRPWESPVDRWFIYQMIPGPGIEAGALAQLQAPSPPQGYWSEEAGQYIDDGSTITTRAWHLYQETGCWGKPFWVIQGSKGGHKRWFDKDEQKMLFMAGLPVHPPTPGDLPYAPFDNKVVEALMKHDALREENGRIRTGLNLTIGGFRARQEAEARMFRIKFLSWLEDQVSEAGEGVPESLMKLDSPRVDVDVRAIEQEEEEARERFIETGTFTGARSRHTP
jgi:hypothetical protein